jgi:hypothetical protein
VRKFIAVALLLMAPLLCGVDTSPIGAPAESAGAMHALAHRDEAGVPGDLTLLAAAAFVTIALLVGLTSPQASPPRRGRLATAAMAPLAVGWRGRPPRRGPPVLA